MDDCSIKMKGTIDYIHWISKALKAEVVREYHSSVNSQESPSGSTTGQNGQAGSTTGQNGQAGPTYFSFIVACPQGVSLKANSNHNVSTAGTIKFYKSCLNLLEITVKLDGDKIPSEIIYQTLTSTDGKRKNHHARYSIVSVNNARKSLNSNKQNSKEPPKWHVLVHRRNLKPVILSIAWMQLYLKFSVIDSRLALIQGKFKELLENLFFCDKQFYKSVG